MTITAMTDLDRVEEIHEYFDQPAHQPMLQVASDKTLYVWQHFSEFTPTRQVLRDGPISELRDEPDPSIGGVVVARPDGSSASVDDFFDASTMDALLVIHRGAVAFERYKTMRAFDKHQWFSCGKTIAGMLTAILVAEGTIDPSRSVSSYLPELAGSGWDDVTVAATLDMATGLDSTEHDEQPVDDGRTNPKRGWFKWAVSLGIYHAPDGSRPSSTEVLRGMKRVKPAETAYEYNSINTFVLERILSRVTGVAVSELFSDRVWRRIGAQADAFIGTNRYGQANSWGMTNSTLRDLGRWGLVFTPSRSVVSDEPIVPDSVIHDIQTGGHPEIFGKGRYGQQLQSLFPRIEGLANHLQWDIVFPDGDFAKLGVGGQGLYVSRRNDAVVVWFSTGTQDDEHAALVAGRAIADSLGG